MKMIALIGLLTLSATSAFALDFKDKLMEAAKDKKNQEEAKEIAKKGMEYIKSEKKEAPKVEVAPVAAPAPEQAAVPAPVKKKKAKKAKKKSKE